MPSADKDMEQQELSFIAGWNAKWYSHFWRYFVTFLTKLNIVLPYSPAIMLLGIYTNELKT